MHQTTLNERQQEVVDTVSGPVLVLAGAGAGKTKTITHRILHLIEMGTDPTAILAVTFTNKAAKEMRDRVVALLTEHPNTERALSPSDTPTVSTFHALGVSLIRAHASLLGLTRHFTIYDRSDSVRAIKNAIIEAGFDPKQFAPRSVLGTISKQKGDGVLRGTYEQHAGNTFYPRLVADVWARYEHTLAQERALDFDDLLVKALTLLTEHPDLARHYQEKWRYLHVDEYQDTNRIQYALIRLLAAQHRNICCVGDVDQNIYAWRGATVENILAFERQYPDARVILLEQNYRSTKTIIAASNDIIEKNIRRRPKKLFTENIDGEPIGLFVAYDENDEAQFVAQECKRRIRAGASPDSFAVLYRANFQSRALEEAFLAEEVPYQVLGVRFFERKEIKDVLAMLRAAHATSTGNVSPADIARTINVPARGIGKVTLARVLSGARDTLPRTVRKNVEAYFSFLDSVYEKMQNAPPSHVLRFAIEESGLERALKAGSEEDHERLENLKELVTLGARYDTLAYPHSIEKLLDDAVLASDQDELKDNARAVKLMTVHASKGLEFDTVFITGLETDLFPHTRVDEETDDEEERRLFYVALTRARQHVFLTYANVRTVYGTRRVTLPSEFLLDIDPTHMVHITRTHETTSEKEHVIYLD